MSAERPPGTLSIRRWFMIALVCAFLIPAAVTGITVFHVGVGDKADQRLSAAEDTLGDDVSLWEDPAWQEATRDELAAQDIDFILTENDREIYRSSPAPLGDTANSRIDGAMRQIMLPGDGTEYTAYIYAVEPQGPPSIWIPFVPLSALLLTLGGIGWLIGIAVVKPLAATNRAAQQVAEGDLDVALPSSRVREVAELNATFVRMSAELSASLRQRTRLEEERRLFISAIAHDLRTPLFSLRGSLQGLEQDVADTLEKRRRYVAIAQDKADALERLIADLFDFTRLEYLEQQPDREMIALDELLQGLVDDLQPRAEAAGIALDIAIPDQPCEISGDQHLLTRAIGNLLDNAFAFTPRGGEVRVTCRAEPGSVAFSVTDTGPGIPDDDLPHIFTALYRGEESRNRQTGGAGLGLTIARRIMQAHGGDLKAANAETGGAVFTGTIPTR